MLDIIEKNLNFLNLILSKPEKPTWSTENEIIYETEAFALRQFKKSNNNDLNVLFVPPQAGHSSQIVDYEKGKSLVELSTHYFDNVYSIDWKSATYDRQDEGIDDLILQLNSCVNYINKKIDLVGLCQGGWQSAIYTSLFPQKVNTLTLAAAPIDFDSNSKIQMWTTLIPLLFYQQIVNFCGGIQPGYMQLLGFKFLNPVERFYFDYIDLYDSLNDPEKLNKILKFRNWYEYTQNISGTWFLEAVKKLFKENRLIKGELEVLNRIVDLKEIYHDLYLIAGEEDDVTLVNELFNIEHYISSKNIYKTVIPDCGHIGCFMGTSSIKNFWPDIFEKIIN